MSGVRTGARVGIDVGGTFTDVALEVGGRRFTSKVLTTTDDPAVACMRALEEGLVRSQTGPSDIDVIIHGTTLATNAILERKGATTSLVTTEGFRDTIEMGFERFSTACANAYVRPLIERYLDRFDASLRERGFRCPLLLMLSSGGLTTVETAKRFPVRIGPGRGSHLRRRDRKGEPPGQGDVLRHGRHHRENLPRRRWLGPDEPPIRGSPRLSLPQGRGIPLRIPVIDMVEIGAGGGSIAWIDELGRLSVGPESAGAQPGPASRALAHRDSRPAAETTAMMHAFFAAAEDRADIAASAVHQPPECGDDARRQARADARSFGRGLQSPGPDGRARDRDARPRQLHGHLRDPFPVLRHQSLAVGDGRCRLLANTCHIAASAGKSGLGPDEPPIRA